MSISIKILKNYIWNVFIGIFLRYRAVIGSRVSMLNGFFLWYSLLFSFDDLRTFFTLFAFIQHTEDSACVSSGLWKAAACKKRWWIEWTCKRLFLLLLMKCFMKVTNVGWLGSDFWVTEQSSDQTSLRECQTVLSCWHYCLPHFFNRVCRIGLCFPQIILNYCCSQT